MNATNKKEYSDAMVDWIKDLVKERYEAEKSAYQSLESYLIANFYLVTLVFNQRKILEKYKSEELNLSVGEVELKQFKHLYNLVCREALGRNYHKAPNGEKPLSVACIDANGSRYWSELGELDNIHIHSIWVMNPSIKMCFDKVVAKVADKGDVFDIDDVDIKRYTSDIEKVISYTMKFDAFTRNKDDAGVAFHILPQPI